MTSFLLGSLAGLLGAAIFIPWVRRLERWRPVLVRVVAEVREDSAEYVADRFGVRR